MKPIWLKVIGCEARARKAPAGAKWAIVATLWKTFVTMRMIVAMIPDLSLMKSRDATNGSSTVRLVW